MATYTTRVTLTKDRRITVEVPEEMPLGEAEVTVCVDEDDDPEISGTASQLLEWMRNRPQPPLGWTPRTKEEIDASIRAMRDEWDR